MIRESTPADWTAYREYVWRMTSRCSWLTLPDVVTVQVMDPLVFGAQGTRTGFVMYHMGEAVLMTSGTRY